MGRALRVAASRAAWGLLVLLASSTTARAGAVLDEVQSVRDGFGVSGIIRPMTVAVSPDGRHVYASNLISGDVSLLVFARNTGDGVLTFVQLATGQTGTTLLGELAITPDGGHVLLPGAALTVHARDALTGELTFVEQHMESGGPEGFTGAQAVAVSPDSAQVYALARLPASGLAVYARDAGTGVLTLVEVQQDGVAGVAGLTGARDVTVSPDGAQVYVAGPDGIVVFDRDGLSGALTLLAVQSGLPATNLRVSADGAYAYAGATDFSITVFDRLPDGSLTHAAGTFDPSGGVPVALDPAGAYVFTPMTLATRDGGTGLVTLTDQLENAVGGVAYVGGARSVAVSPDGETVYVAAPLDSALTSFHPRATVSCSPTPVAPCRASGATASTLTLKDRVRDEDRVIWKFKKGGATSIPDFDDPVTTTNDYALCIYDGSAAPQPVLEAVAPAGALWSEIPNKGYRYSDPRRVPARDGMATIDLRQGLEGKTKLSVLARRSNIPMPALPLTLPLVVQMQSAAGQCWGSSHATALVNDATLLKSKSD